MGGRTHRKKAARQRAAKAAETPRGPARLAIRVLLALAVLILLVSAYPTYEYWARGESVDATLGACDRKGSTDRATCTTRWETAAGRACEVRLDRVYVGRDEIRPTATIRVNGCAERGFTAPAVFLAMLVVLAIAGATGAVQRLRGRSR